MEAENLVAVGNYRLPEHLYYDEATHFWVEVDDPAGARCGFDPLGSETCGDIVAVSFEPVGTRVARGQAFGSLEAAKFVGPLIAPISGTIAGWNHQVLANPRLLNLAPLEHWLVKLTAPALEEELAALCHGRERISRWFASEIERFKTQGMVAE